MADTNKSRADRKQLVIYLTLDDYAALRQAAAALDESMQVIARRGIRREVKRVAAEAAKGGKSMAMTYEQLDRFQRIFERQITCDDAAERGRAVESLGVDGYLDEAERQAPEPWPAGFREWARKQLAADAEHRQKWDREYSDRRAAAEAAKGAGK